MRPNPANLPCGSADSAAEALELAAAEWLVLQDHGLNAAQQREFEAWLAADANHAAAYARLLETWDLIDRVPADRVPLPARRRHGWWWASGAVAAAAAAIAVMFVPPRANAPRLVGPVHQEVTAVGEFEALTLADGSVARLNTATELGVNFSATERRVTLQRGEASFEVAKDPARPFVVRVGDVEVRAVGTVFNIRQSERGIEVLVVEGKVRVDDATSGQSLVGAREVAANGQENGPEPLLIAGQRATIPRPLPNLPARASVSDVAPAESARALAWHSRELEFSNEPLADIAAEFNRYNRHHLVIDDAELGAQRFGGKFPADDFASLVRLLELNFAVTVERRDGETVLRRRAPGR
jgi:transmembrane sensor